MKPQPNHIKNWGLNPTAHRSATYCVSFGTTMALAACGGSESRVTEDLDIPLTRSGNTTQNLSIQSSPIPLAYSATHVDEMLKGEGHSLVIGAPVNLDSVNSNESRGPGAVYIFSSDAIAGSEPVDLNNIQEAALIIGAYDSSYLGLSVSNIGDFNGDGKDDLYASMPISIETRASGGVVIIGGGVQSGETIYLEGNIAGRGLKLLHSHETDDVFIPGNLVAPLGDIDQDGFSDLLVNSSLSSPLLLSEQSQTIAYVYFGHELDPLDGDTVFLDTPSAAVAPIVSNSGVISETTLSPTLNAADFNGDGINDVIINGIYRGSQDSELDITPYETVIISGKELVPGEAFNFDTASEGVVKIFNSDPSAFEFVTSVGDLNGDMCAEALVFQLRNDDYETVNSSGKIYIIDGSQLLNSDDIIDLGDSDLVIARIDIDGALFSFSPSVVVDVGDVDGDAGNDIIFATIDWSGDDNDPVQLSFDLILNQTLRLAAGGEVLSNEATSIKIDLGDDVGSSVISIIPAAAGDIDSDGLNDIVFLAPHFEMGADNDAIPSSDIGFVLYGSHIVDSIEQGFDVIQMPDILSASVFV